jgi:ADP-dependent NAD(P)H-hydrate dehydratase / NAD(P)H-hydrate epimerase
MRWLIIGTVPRDDFPLYEGPCRLERGRLFLDGQVLAVARGTPALLAAALLASEVLGIEAPRTLLAGDTGHGRGSTEIYRHLCGDLDRIAPELLVFHYLQPDVDWHNRVYMAIEDLKESPVTIADAGYMYVAKMSGYASSYDLFTPDAGEMAFLADEAAPHPFYTRGFILQEDEKIPELIERAYAHENAARHLLVKGRADLVATREGISDRIGEPSIEAMEPIGGTGDSLTGLVSAMIAGRCPIVQSCSIAARANRIMGLLANPTPAFSIGDLLKHMPEAIERSLPA